METLMASERLRLGLGLGRAGNSFSTILDIAAEAESAGFDLLATGDNGTETFALMGALAARTESIGLVSSIAGWTRSPATMAHAAATVQNLSNGRFTLGIGPTPKIWVNGWHGMDFDPVIPRMREYITAVRAALDSSSAEPTELDGTFYSTHGYANWDVHVPKPVPIMLGATQRRMTELSGEVADGVMLNSIHPIDWIEQNATSYVEAGRIRGGREGTPFERGIGRFVGISDDREVAYDLARAQLSFYFEIPYFRALLEPMGYGEELDAGEKAIRDGDRTARVKAVSDRMVDDICIAGTRDEVREKLARYEGLVDWLVVEGGMNLDETSALANVHELTETFRRERV
jgi:alkanesulfonate monooxygenase SsuD/methylene tetrahydromethanopterin reductase-like flavin-dependent oxidoreductase (luciferase family)